MNCLVCLMVIVFTALVEMSVSVGQKVSGAFNVSSNIVL